MEELQKDKLAKIKCLLATEGIGPSKIYNLIAKFKKLDLIFSAKLNEIISIGNLNSTLAKKIYNNILRLEQFYNSTEKEIDGLENIGADMYSFWDKQYPELLKKIYTPPIILYQLGELIEADKNAIAIVGTRKSTNYGKLQTERFAKELVEQRITIVSGMARGIDTYAQSAALKYNGRTIAVVGSGLDVIYPAENKNLFKKIHSEQRGAIISEYPLGTKPDAVNFPKRNRIISGLSLGVLVVETRINGGAMQTVNFGIDQNREIFAIPGNLTIPQSEGTNYIIRKNMAKLVQKSDDILEELQLRIKPILGKTIPKKIEGLSLFEQKLLDALSGEPIHIDALAKKNNMSVSECLVNLLTLEFKGIVKQFPGKTFARI